MLYIRSKTIGKLLCQRSAKKFFSRAAGKQVAADDFVIANIDYAMAHDGTGVLAGKTNNRRGFAFMHLRGVRGICNRCRGDGYGRDICTGKLWLRVPQTIRITVEGKLSKGVSAKDLTLNIIKNIGTDGANYRAIEYYRETIQGLSMAQRMTLCNMSTEME